jgi:hypothetical protein
MEVRKYFRRIQAARKAVFARWAKANSSCASAHKEIAPRPVESPDRSKELTWLAKYSREYAGLWVALDGDRLIASDPVARVVFSTARERGVVRPFVAHLEDVDSPPFGGW